MVKDLLSDYMGPWWSETAVLQALQLDAETAAQHRAERKLLAIRFNDGNFYYPARQFLKDPQPHVLPGLRQVLDALASGIDDTETWAVWLAGEFTEGMTVYDALAAGLSDEVVLLAKRDAASWRS